MTLKPSYSGPRTPPVQYHDPSPPTSAVPPNRAVTFRLISAIHSTKV